MRGLAERSTISRVYQREDSEKSVASYRSIEGELGSNDTQTRKEGHTTDVYTLSDYISGDVKIELESTFDAEMGLYDKVSGKMLGYRDWEGENDLETLIVGSSDLIDGELRTFNFDKDILGTYNFRISRFFEASDISVGEEANRALTEQDHVDYDSDEPRLYYEWVDLEGTSSHEKITVVARTLSSFWFNLGIWDTKLNEYVARDSGSYVRLDLDLDVGTNFVLAISSRDRISIIRSRSIRNR